MNKFNFTTIRQICLICTLSLLGVVAAAQSNTGGNNAEAGAEESQYIESVYKSFIDLYKGGIDEKLYLQTDKPYYSGGEQIWFKGHLVNAVTHTPLRISNFIYVELLASNGDLVSRVKVKRDSTGFNGYLTLDPEIAADDYTMRGYSRWQRNMEPEYLFSKSVEIVSPIPPTKSQDGELVKTPNRTIAEKKAQREREKKSGLKAIKYDLQFFPEGGVLLPGLPQTVAFKAIGEDGLSVEIEGAYYNSKGDRLGEFKSTHSGMGLLSFIPQAGEQYHAKATSHEGVEMSFDMPAVDAEGATLKISKMGEKIYFQTLTTNPALLEGSHILIHSRGEIATIIEGSVLTARYIEEDRLGDGVNVISLIDSQKRVLAERVLFVYPDLLPTLEIESDKDDYARRERAKVTVRVRGVDGTAAQGEFGVSVTDCTSVVADPTRDDLISYLMLSSEIKGHIENPGLYFVENSAENDRNLDLLMRTQGWRRFNLEDVLNDHIAEREFKYEAVTEIRGDVKGFFGNKAKRPYIHIINPKTHYLDAFELGELNSFNLVGLDIPDSTTYIIQARGRRSGGTTLTLNIEEETFPEGVVGIIDREVKGGVPISFVSQSQEKFVYDGGMNVINLEAITVTKDLSRENEYGAYATQSIRREELERIPSMTLPFILQRYPGMSVSTEGVSYRKNSSFARFIVNGMDMEYEDVVYLTSDEIEQLDFFTGADAAMFYDSAGGIFTITTRMDYTAPLILPPNVVHVAPLGYQRRATHYQPRYEVASLKETLPPDYRTTIYWNGELLSDENGEISFEFFTADKATSYKITVEGVTEDGELCKASSVISRTRAY